MARLTDEEFEQVIDKMNRTPRARWHRIRNAFEELAYRAKQLFGRAPH